MYVVQLNSTQRNYLLSLLKSRRASTARLLAWQLKTAEDVFGVTMWADDDIRSKLQEYEVPDTPENVEKVRHSYYGRHIDDRMVECGWNVLEQGVFELKAAVAGED
jgi:hypothetical protein